ncbi:unnamed protein product [Vicia faba]|uniref:Uncharacterized protein n=1 Tax=Vicia faba TaxID=3906 RepID=A0AAV0YT13_VICFA|nr:unnamed protein product [Vicia faba]
MTANNDDGIRLGRETQHAFVRHERARIQNEHVRARRRTIPRLLDGEALTSRIHMSFGFSSQGHVSLTNVNQKEATAAHGGVPPLADPYPGGPSVTSLMIYVTPF